MPNYRSKNRNRNKNKQRNKQQQQQQQQQQQEKQQQKEKEENCKKDSKEPLSSTSNSAPTKTTGHEKQTPPHSAASKEVTNTSEISSENNVADANASTKNKSNELDATKNKQSLTKVPDVTNATTATEPKTKTTLTTTETNDTVLHEPSHSDNKIENKHGVNATDKMGNEKSKIINNQSEPVSTQNAEEVQHTTSHPTTTNIPAIPPNASVLGKVVVHRIVCEDSNSVKTNKEPTSSNEVTIQTTQTSASSEAEKGKSTRNVAEVVSDNPTQLKQNQHYINISNENSIVTEDDLELPQQEKKIIVHKIITADDDSDEPLTKSVAESDKLTHHQKVKVIVHKVDTLCEEDEGPNNYSATEEQKLTPEVKKPGNEENSQKSSNKNDNSEANNTREIEAHKFIRPDDVTIPSPQQHQAKVIVHQIILEDKEIEPKITSPTMKEPILAALAMPTTSEVKIVEISDESLSDLEELRSPVVSEAESSIEYSDDNQRVSDSITEVSSSSSGTSSQRQSRKQKRIALEHHFLPQMLNPRFLDSISEENSELSDNSDNPLSRSASTESATNCPTEGKVQKLNAKYPKSALDFSKSHKQQTMHNRKSKVIREEPVAVSVAARLQDAPNADESCTTVRSCMSPEAEAAEVVFINSASSSMSDLRDLELLENFHTSMPEINLDTDLKVIINKPATENICFDTLTSSTSLPSPTPTPPPLSPLTSVFTAKTPQQQVPEFCAYPNNNYNNNQIINNSKFINNNTSPTPHIPATTATTIKTRSLAETDTKLNANFQTDSILSSSSSSPANEQLVFAQIEEQISSVLSSINEVASQHIATTIQTTSSSSTSSPLKFHTNLSNTQKLPVTTTSTTATARTLRTSSEESFGSNSSSSFCAVNNAKTSRIFSKDVNMNTVRDIINNNNNSNNASDNTVQVNGNSEKSAPIGYVKLNYNNSNTFTPIPPPRGSPPPPPIPPPSHEHQQAQGHDECDNIRASALSSSISASSYALPLLKTNVDYHNTHTQSPHDFSQSLKTALSLLTSSKRQESMDSHCSDSTNLSQCTAINVATEQRDKSDSVKASLISDLKINASQHSQPSDNNSTSATDPKKLRLLCAETLASHPYGDVVLEELATVAENIGEARAIKAFKSDEKMPYPLPELPHIDDLQLSLKVGKSIPDRPQPPQQDHSWLGVPTNNDPKVLVCLSPSQRSYIKHKPEQKPDDLLDAHQKFMERRGYHEYTKEQIQNLEREKLAEQQLLQTAAIMKKLRKSLTPPPPQIPPPPVPVKSSETASKAQNLSKRTVTTASTTHTQIPSGDVNSRSNGEQKPATSNGESNGEENKHRLLSIMQDTNESIAKKQNDSVTSSSLPLSYENNSRQTTNSVSAPAKEQEQLPANSSYQFVNPPKRKATGNMQSVETSLGQMFPTIGTSNIFDQEHKRFSNIELSNTEPFCSQIMNTQPKRYSSVETHSFEAQKRIENGKVIEDFSTKKHETKSSGDKPENFNGFPLKTSSIQESNNFFSSGKEQDKSTHNTNDQEIMSALNLNKHSSDTERKQQQATTQNEKTIKITTTETKTAHQIANDENRSAETDVKSLTKQIETENNLPKSGIQDTYEEFRQRAKAAADAASTLPSPTSSATASMAAKLTSNGDNNVETISSTMSSESTKTETSHLHKTTMSSHDHEKLFREFDDLSKQLHKELESSKVEREQREKSASMFDLNKVHMRQKQQIEEFNKTRHEHLKELEQEIERSVRARSLKLSRPLEATTDVVDHQTGRTYEIPIHIENGSTKTPAPSNIQEEAPPIPKHPKTYQIPIQIEHSAPAPSYVDDTRFRRAESMFNLTDDAHHRQRTLSNQTQYQRAEDDWSKYASDLGSSENIARPFAKEVEICYQRRPEGIRAPRLTVSTNDLSLNNQHSYDKYNAYNVRRHHAPMLNRPPEQSRPKYGSCYSMIERDPNPKYISTTTRRGVSPAPQPTGYFPLDGCHVREEDMRQRRASLPRELHEQQLKYITSKEEELRTEFERLQAERRRLMEEAHKAQTAQIAQAQTSPITPTRSLRDHYRQTQKLPTLTEDEVFRQQMAEEWLNKVAERENRRLQNIIKISKIHEDEASSKHQADMGEEFLSRVKERRHKLAMPADSDWESGAESQPHIQAQLSEAEDVPPVTILEGEQEASLRRLPRHLREFAKFSNHQKEKIEGGHREQHQEEERSEETTDNSISRAFKKSSVVKTVKTLRAPMLPENHGHENDNDDYRNDNDEVGDHDFDVATLNRNTFAPFSNFSSIRPSSSEFLTEFPGSFDEMFGKSPFRGRIFEEFNNYWRNFHDTGNKF